MEKKGFEKFKIIFSFFIRRPSFPKDYGVRNALKVLEGVKNYVRCS